MGGLVALNQDMFDKKKGCRFPRSLWNESFFV
jgi:hypothetical protein